jgi:hypothetical protein
MRASCHGSLALAHLLDRVTAAKEQDSAPPKIGTGAHVRPVTKPFFDEAMSEMIKAGYSDALRAVMRSDYKQGGSGVPSCIQKSCVQGKHGAVLRLKIIVFVGDSHQISKNFISELSFVE